MAVQPDGSLRVQQPNTKGYFTLSAPKAWQERDGRRLPVPVAFTTPEAQVVGFTVGRYDPTRPLLIDPTYAWHTNYGSAGWDGGYAIAVDGSGNLYVTGYSRVTWDTPLQPHSGNLDIVVLKLAGDAGPGPDPFTFIDVTGVPLSTPQVSNIITVSGLTAPAPIAVSGDVSSEYAINGGGWTSTPGTVNNGDTVQVRHTSAATFSTSIDTTLTIGGVSDTFTSTTLGPDLTGVWNRVAQFCSMGRCFLGSSVRVWNQGNADAPSFRLRVLLSGDAVLDPGDTVLREAGIWRLRPGQSQTIPVLAMLPLGVSASGKYLFAVIDALNQVPETNETNNTPMTGPVP